jgi:folate-binding protein YgfZ
MQNTELTHHYQTLTTTWGYFPLENWTVLTIRGDDRASFLHNMCTQEIRQRAPGHGCELFLTDVKGHVIAHSYLQVEEDCLRLLAVPGQATVIIAHMDRYIIREDVILADETSRWDSLLVLGPEAMTRLPALAIDQRPTSITAFHQPWQHTQWVPTQNRPKDSPWEVAQTDWLHVPCYLLQAPSDRLATSLAQQNLSQQRPPAGICQVLETAGAQPCNAMVWTALRIESGLPLWDVDFNQTNLPQEVARDSQAISFNKGCYLGQETIARIDALGHVNQQLTTIRFDGEKVPDVGMILRAEGKQVGTVTSACWSPCWNRPLALAMVRRGFNTPGTRLESAIGTAAVLKMGATEKQ